MDGLEASGVHAYNFVEAVSQLVTGTNFWSPKRESVFMKDVKVFSTRTAPHLLVRRAALDPT